MLKPGQWICPFATDDLHFFWHFGTGGDDFQWGYNPELDEWFSDPDDFALCLIGSYTRIPLGNWAIAVGIFLIVAATVIRFRRL